MMIKAAKDVLLCLIVLLFFCDILTGRPILYDPLVSFLIALLAVCFAVTYLEWDPVLALIGLRRTVFVRTRIHRV